MKEDETNVRMMINNFMIYKKVNVNFTVEVGCIATVLRQAT